MNILSQSFLTMSDEELWRLSRDGDREAFSRIVERYQSLVCSLAYSKCGNLAASEDLAQETFLTAWRRLQTLREPEKLRAWLCGIVRQLTANTQRRTFRRGGDPEPLEFVAEQPSPVSDPAAATVQREEEALLWRTLAEMPESYREPLILFYREQQSVSEVATQLDLTEEVVKQRLSRGRALLRLEMTAFVESTLTRTRPTAVFTAGVLAALPFANPSSATAASLAGAAAKAVLSRPGVGVAVGPAIGLLMGGLISRLIQSSARSQAERRCIARYARYSIVWCFIMSVLLALSLSFAGELYKATPVRLLSGVMVWVVALVTVLMGLGTRMQREVSRIRSETGTDDESFPEPELAQGMKPAVRFESKQRLLGLPLYSIAFGGIDPDFYRKQTARGWIAIGDYALSPLLAVGGFAIAPVALGGTTIGGVSIGGVSLGGLALGLIAAGGWSFGGIALGWLGAAGAMAIAHGHVLGFFALAPDANTAEAKDWFRSLWFVQGARFVSRHAIWPLLLGVMPVLVTLLLRVSRTVFSSR